jgi:hypothetical protein
VLNCGLFLIFKFSLFKVYIYIYKYFRDKRDFVSGGAAAGVAGILYMLYFLTCLYLAVDISGWRPHTLSLP